MLWRPPCPVHALRGLQAEKAAADKAAADKAAAEAKAKAERQAAEQVAPRSHLQLAPELTRPSSDSYAPPGLCAQARLKISLDLARYLT